MRNNINAIRMTLAILCSLYISSIIWFILISSGIVEVGDEDDGNPIAKDNFITYYGLLEMTNINAQIVSAYYSLTTLSTVGFGDYHPISDGERLSCAFMMFLGVAVYSFIADNFYKMIESL